MKKTLTANGVNGQFTGEVEIIFNARIGTKTIHNRITHDDEGVRYTIHQIRGIVDGKELPAFETEYEDKIVELADSMEKQIINLLKWQAEVVKKPSLDETLKSKGYL